MCDICSAELCSEDTSSNDSCEGMWCGNICGTCSKVMCHKCMGETCGYCSDPAGLKEYFCKNHQEPECLICDELICQYCRCDSYHCPNCDVGPLHEHCMNKHKCCEAYLDNFNK